VTVVAREPTARRAGTPPTRLGLQFGGLGSAVPAGRVTNADLARRVETSDTWIVERTGIRERRVVAPGQATSDLAVVACREALASVVPKHLTVPA